MKSVQLEKSCVYFTELNVLRHPKGKAVRVSDETTSEQSFLQSRSPQHRPHSPPPSSVGPFPIALKTCNCPVGPAMVPACLLNQLVAIRASALQDAIQTELDASPFGQRKALLEERSRGAVLVQRWIKNDDVCFNETGMHPSTFRDLSRTLEELGLVGSTRHLPRDLRLGMSLYMLRKAATFRTMQEHFQVSMRSLSLCVRSSSDSSP